jgi:hypothetical protein
MVNAVKAAEFGRRNIYELAPIFAHLALRHPITVAPHLMRGLAFLSRRLAQ